MTMQAAKSSLPSSRRRATNGTCSWAYGSLPSSSPTSVHGWSSTAWSSSTSSASSPLSFTTYGRVQTEEKTLIVLPMSFAYLPVRRDDVVRCWRQQQRMYSSILLLTHRSPHCFLPLKFHTKQRALAAPFES